MSSHGQIVLLFGLIIVEFILCRFLVIGYVHAHKANSIVPEFDSILSPLVLSTMSRKSMKILYRLWVAEG